MARLSILSLGTLHITVDDAPISGFNSDKARALLVYLVMESQRAHRRERLAGLFWPEYPEDHARHTLSQVLSNVRQVIGDRNPDHPAPFLDITHQAARFNRASDYWLDVELLAALPPSSDPHQAIACCEQAIAVYRGHFLEGLSIGDSPAFEEWILMQRERWQRVAIGTLAKLVEGYTGLGDYDKALHYAWRQLELDPWREDTHRQVMQLLVLSGQRTAALAQYNACRRTLLDELGTEPEAETISLYETIKAGDLAFPHPSTPLLPHSPTPPHNLPAQLTPLIGRDSDLTSLRTRLQDPACRLLTLVGPGGIGKTRLALDAVAPLVPNFTHGVFIIALTPLQSAQAIVPTIAQTLGLTFSDKGGPQKQQLLAYLKNKMMLLVLDNAEHLLSPPSVPPDGGEIETERGMESATAGDVIIRILEAAPGIKVLVTSRVRLNILGEHLFPVRELAYPEKDYNQLETVQDLAAVQLFVQSARRLRPDFALTENNIRAVSDICRYVQGNPLAILLTATWTTTLSTANIAALLTGEITSHSHGLDLLQTDWHNVPPRHRNLRAVFEHSWCLLTDHAQNVMQVLSVFRGVFTADAALIVADATPHDLRSLVNASFLNREISGRYTIHELLRQYAAEKLAQSGSMQQKADNRHGEYYIKALYRWGKDLLGPRQLIALQEIHLDIDNVRTAWEYAINERQTSWLQEGMNGLGRYCQWHANHEEGIRLFGMAQNPRGVSLTLSGIFDSFCCHNQPLNMA